MKVIPITEEMALTAGRLLLSQQDVPIADALIASPVKMGDAQYVVTDDTHYQTLKIRTKWIGATHSEGEMIRLEGSTCPASAAEKRWRPKNRIRSINSSRY